MAQSALEFDPGGRQEARGEQRSDGENGGCIRLAILLFLVNRLLDREVDFIIIFSSSFFSCLPTCAPCWSAFFFLCWRVLVNLARSGRVYGYFTTITSCRIFYCAISPLVFRVFLHFKNCARPAETNKGVRDAQPPSGVSRPQNAAFRLRLNRGLCEAAGA